MMIFFFQAEDGIRDGHVTGVQTCALPIWAMVGAPELSSPFGSLPASRSPSTAAGQTVAVIANPVTRHRSEERRVGKEDGSRMLVHDAKDSTNEEAVGDRLRRMIELRDDQA